MKQATVLACLAAFATAAQHKHFGHQGLHKRQEVVTDTKTVVVWDVVTVTVTGSAPASSDTYGAVDTSSSAASSAAMTSSSSTSVYVAPLSSSTSSSTTAHQKAEAKVASAANVASSSSVPAAPAAPAKAPAYQAPASGSSDGSAPASGNMLKGDVTYYGATGLSTCGYYLSNANATVAVALDKFGGLSNSGVNQPSSPLCNKKINIYPSGPSGPKLSVTVTDGCQGCGPNDLDLPQTFFQRNMPALNGKSNMEVGRYKDISWEWAD